MPAQLTRHPFRWDPVHSKETRSTNPSKRTTDDVCTNKNAREQLLKIGLMTCATFQEHGRLSASVVDELRLGPTRPHTQNICNRMLICSRVFVRCNFWAFSGVA